nr:MAG TPA: hypothetical protein [Caudoviricetes sp.]
MSLLPSYNRSYFRLLMMVGFHSIITVKNISAYLT